MRGDPKLRGMGNPTNVFPHFQNGVSLSGLERNRLWINLDGREFVDISGVSAFDDPADGRAVALLLSLIHI